MKRNMRVSIVMAGLLGGAGALVLNIPGVPGAHEGKAFAQSSTEGAVRGIIKDKKTGEAVVGATVVATGPALQGQQAQITDENGSYVLDSLPPGTYTITVYYNDAQFTRGNVLISVGKQAVVNVPIDTDTGGGETIVIKGNAPIVDQGSTKTGVTITDEFTQNVPVGRTFGAVLGAAAGSQGDTYGQGFSGSGSAENRYIVEGIDTTDTAYGLLSSNLPNEFVQETEVITGGYNAEFGRSTGGVVNVVTKGGSNEFHGSVFGYYTPGALVATADKIQREGSAIGTESNLKYSADLGAELGGPIIKDKLWFHVGINPSLGQTDVARTISSQVDKVDNATGMAGEDGNPDVDPNTGFTVFDEVKRRIIPVKSQTYFFTAKISGALSQNHQYQISAFGNPGHVDDIFRVQGANSARLYKYDNGAFDYSGKWTSKFADNKTQVDAVLGYHRAQDDQQPYSAAQNTQQVFFDYSRPLSDFMTNEGSDYSDKCTDGGTSDLYPMIDNCPVNRYNSGGLGFLESRKNNRLSGVVSVTERVRAAGHHTFKVGFDGEQVSYNSGRRETGGSVYRQRSTKTWQIREFVKFDPAGSLDCGLDAKCSPTPQLNADTQNRGYAGYAQDQWEIRPNLTLDLGLRWEQQDAYTAKFLHGTVSPEGEKIPDKAFSIKNSWAPRLGVIYDPTAEGRSKVFGHWGRFYEAIPLDLNVRSLGGEITHFADIGKANSLCMNSATAMTVADLAGCTPVTASVLGGGISYIAPDMKGQYLDEAILGAEYELMPDFKVGVSYVHRTLPVVIEDMSTDGGSNYLIANPGENYDAAAKQLTDQAAKLLADGDPSNDGLADLATLRAAELSSVKRFDKPVRNYDAVQLTATQRFSKSAMMLASYTYSKNKGNYPGLFSTETTQLDPNITSLYDLPDLMANRYGALGLDRPHLVKLDGFYQFDLKKAGLIVLGASLRAQSGLAQNTLGAHPVYGSGESYLMPRGAAGRSPTTFDADVKGTYGRKIGKNMTLEAFVDIFNLFNSQDETSIDEVYTFQSANPVVGGTPDDLAHSKAISDDTGLQSGTTAILNPNYGHLDARQAPLSARFGLRLTF